MKFALQRCCTTPVFLKQYEASTNALLETLGVQFVDVKGFGCCGYPLRNYNHRAYLLSSAKNLALAEKDGLDVLTFCNCCYGSLKHAAHFLGKDPHERERVNGILAKEGLRYSGRAEVRHLLGLLYKDIVAGKIERRIIRPFVNLKIAAHYGCHVLRPRQIVGFDNALSPTILDRLIEITGAKSVPWARKLECCGSPMWGVDDDLSMDLTQRKIESARDSGADFLCVACPYCQLQFDRVQRMEIAKRNGKQPLAPILYTQLLGLSLGIDPEDLGIGLNELDSYGLMRFLRRPRESASARKTAASCVG